MLKQDHKEKNSNELLDDMLDRNGLILDGNTDEAHVACVEAAEEVEAADAACEAEPSDAVEDTQALAVRAEDDLVAEDEFDDEEEDEPVDDDDDKPIEILDQRVFGMSRYQFWGVAGGFGVGYIISGGLAALGLKWAEGGMTVGVICAAIGWFLFGRLHKKKLAEREAARQSGTDCEQNRS